MRSVNTGQMVVHCVDVCRFVMVVMALNSRTDSGLQYFHSDQCRAFNIIIQSRDLLLDRPLNDVLNLSIPTE